MAIRAVQEDSKITNKKHKSIVFEENKLVALDCFGQVFIIN